MKKLSRRERKIYEEGRAAGYAEGYKNGLYDGNPFNALIDGLRERLNVVADAVKDNPELLKQIQEQNTLEIEEGDNDTEGGGTSE